MLSSKIISEHAVLIFAVAVAVAVCAGTFMAADDASADEPKKCGDNLTWEYSESTCTLTISGSGKMYDYPEEGAPWFCYYEHIAAVELPEGLTHIGNEAFSSLISLESVSIPGTVRSIGEGAFFWCCSLKSVSVFGEIKTVGQYAFDQCCSLVKVYNHTDREVRPERLGMPYGVTVIVSKCGNSLEWEYTESDRTLTVTGTGAMYDYYPMHAPWFHCAGQAVKVVLPEGLTRIGGCAFFDFRALESVSIPGTAVSIGSYAFGYCQSLTSVAIPCSVKQIDRTAFGDSGVTAVFNHSGLDIAPGCFGLSDDVTVYARCGKGLMWEYSESDHKLTVSGSGKMFDFSEWGAPWFCFSEHIVSVELPEGLRNIGSYAFELFTSLETVSIPGTVTSIGEGAFFWCSSLRSLYVHGEVGTVGECAFGECGSLSEVHRYSDANIVPGRCGLSRDAAVIDHRCGSGLTWEYSGGDRTLTVSGTGEMYDYGRAKAPWNVYSGRIADVVLPEGLTHIGEFAFSGFFSLRSVSVPGTVVSIGHGAFYDCQTLTSVTMPDSVKTLGGHLFWDCWSLESVDLPGSLETICEKVFDSCPMTSVTIPGSVKDIDARAFECSSIGTVVNRSGVPIAPGGYGLSRDAEVYNVCADGLVWRYTENDRTLHITGSGAMDDFPEGNKAPWRLHCEDTVNLVLSDGITSIGTFAFYQFTSLERITMPETVVSIGAVAFGGCGALTSFVMPDSVKTADGMVFFDCGSLKSVTLSRSLEKMDRSVFWFAPVTTVFNRSSLDIDPAKYSLPNDVNIVEEKDLPLPYAGNDRTPMSAGQGAYGLLPDPYATGCCCSEHIGDAVPPEGPTDIGCSVLSGCASLRTIPFPRAV